MRRRATQARRAAPLLALLPALLCAAPASAEPWTCTMTVLCDGSGCVAMEQPADLIAADHEGQLFLTTPSGDIPMIRLDGAPTARHAAAHAYAGTGPQISGALLTIAGDGTATLTRHARNGPARVTTAYGTCARL